MSDARFPTHEAEERLRELRESGVTTVPLHGTPAPALPAHVTAAVADALGQSTPTVPPRGLPELRSLLAESLGRLGRPVDPERELVVTNGAMHALALCFRSLLAPGDEVLVPTPCFFFAGPVRAAGGTPVYVASDPADDWRWDADGLERAVTPLTKALLLCNPGNPTGHVPKRDEVAAVVAVAERHGLVLVTDEAYEASLWGASLVSAFSLHERVLLVRSLGKSLSMPHLRLGLVAGPPALLDDVATALEWDVLRVGLAPQVAARAILAGPSQWLDDVHGGLAADRDAALATVGDRLEVVPPRGGPFLFVSAGRTGLADELLAAGIPAVDGRHFEAPLWARVPFGGAAASAGLLEDALARWAASAP